MARVRGMAFLGTARFVRRTYGETTLQRIIAAAPAETRHTFRKRIDGLGLHPYESFVGLLRSADRVLGCGDLTFCRNIGDVAARDDLATVFKVYAVRPSAEQMIRACTPIWGMYYDEAGYMEAVSVEPHNTVLRIYDFPAMDKAHCQLMEAWMMAAMDVIGVRVLPDAHEAVCMSDGGPYHEFWCRWQSKGRTK
jgi:hypothetical protein